MKIMRSLRKLRCKVSPKGHRWQKMAEYLAHVSGPIAIDLDSNHAYYISHMCNCGEYREALATPTTVAYRTFLDPEQSLLFLGAIEPCEAA